MLEVQAFMALGRDDASAPVGKTRKPSKRTKSNLQRKKYGIMIIWNTAPYCYNYLL